MILPGDQQELFSPKTIKSVSFSQHQILSWISELYFSGPVDLDPTYGAGHFYRKIPKPRICLDIVPKVSGVWPGDCRSLPIKTSTLKNIILDPPFLARGGGRGLMSSRYGDGDDPAGVWNLYRQAMTECYRVLRKRGILVVKCQDFIFGRTQYMSHVEIMNIAVELGLYPVDLFIFVAKTRPRAWNHQKQNHSRKYHSYFWVFKKAKRTVPYSAPAYKIQGKCCHVHVVKGGAE